MNKVVLITGASSGIGLHTAKLFQAKNWKVAATMRLPENATELQKIVDIECIRLDVTDVDSIKAAIAATLEKFGRIDAVVNNAGYGLLGAFESATPEQIARQFDTNVFGLMNVCREILPYFREQKRGYIVNVTSVGGRMTFPASSLYHATKWAVEGFSESLQYELEEFNIRVKERAGQPDQAVCHVRGQEGGEVSAGADDHGNEPGEGSRQQPDVTVSQHLLRADACPSRMTINGRRHAVKRRGPDDDEIQHRDGQGIDRAEPPHRTPAVCLGQRRRHDERHGSADGHPG